MRKIIKELIHYKEIKKITKSQIEKLEQELQLLVSESRELDIKTKIENTLDIGSISKVGEKIKNDIFVVC